MQIEGAVKRRSSRIPVWAYYALALVAVAIILRVEHDRNKHYHSALQGNHEQAPAALDQVLNSLPASSRLSYVLNLAGRDHSRASEGLRYAIVDWLGQRYLIVPGKGRTLPQSTLLYLESYLQDEDSVVRTRAMEVIHADTERIGLYYLLCGLQDEDPWVAEDAGELLAQWMTRNRQNPLRHDLIPGLIAGLQNRDTDVVQFCTVTLAAALGNNWHVSSLSPKEVRVATTAKWINWWKSAELNKTDQKYSEAGRR